MMSLTVYDTSHWILWYLDHCGPVKINNPAMVEVRGIVQMGTKVRPSVVDNWCEAFNLFWLLRASLCDAVLYGLFNKCY